MKKIAPNGTVSTVTTALLSPNKLAVDGPGNLYVTDAFGLKKITTDGTITTIPTGNNFYPIDVAVDANDTVYVSNGYAVNKIVNNAMINIGSTVTYFNNIALDSAGNVYLSYYNESKIIKIDPDFNQTTIPNTDYSSGGITVDNYGRIYVSYITNFIKKLAYYSIKPSLPQGLTFDSISGVISGTPEASSPLTTYTVTIANDCGVATTTLAFGTCDSTAIVSQSSSQAVCLGKTTILRVEAKGCELAYQWFKNGNPIQDATAANLTINNFSSADVAAYTCTVSGNMGTETSSTINLSISNAPAISYSGANSNYVTGAAITPITPANTGGTITPAQEAVMGLLNPYGVEVDAAGNIYVTESTSAKKIAPDGSVTVLYNGFSNAKGIAVDTAGNVYVVENIYATAVKKISLNGTVSSIGPALSYPTDIALDSAGNMYITESDNASVKKISPTGTVTNIGGGFYAPQGIAIDSANNLYLADTYNSAVKKIAPNGFVTTLLNSAAIIAPTGITVDVLGNVYVTDGYSYTIKKIATNGTITRVINSPAYALAIDTSGTLYAVDGNRTLKKIASNVFGL